MTIFLSNTVFDLRSTLTYTWSFSFFFHNSSAHSINYSSDNYLFYYIETTVVKCLLKGWLTEWVLAMLVVRGWITLSHWINHYPLNSAIGSVITYPLDNGLLCGEHYPLFEQLGPGG